MAKIIKLSDHANIVHHAQNEQLKQYNARIKETLKWIIPGITLIPSAACGLIMYFKGHQTWNLKMIIPGFFVLMLVIGIYSLFRLMKGVAK